MNTRPPLVSIGQLAQELADRAEDVCRRLLPAGRREGKDWVDARRAKGGLGDSLKVCLNGPKAGVFCHWGVAGRPAGDMIDLVAYLVTAGDKGQAARWARAFLGYDDKVDPRTLETRRRQAAAKRKASQRSAEAEAKKVAGRAQKLFIEAQADLIGTPAASYLMGRGIDLRRLDRPVRSLRFHGALKTVDGERTITAPGLVAAIAAADGSFAGVHRTFLMPRADGSWVKRPLGRDGADSKKSYGRYAGGCIRLWNGEHADPATGEVRAGPRWRELDRAIEPHAQKHGGIPVDHPLRRCLISEGIEDGLTAVLARPELRVLVAVSLSNMGAMALPPGIAEVILLRQNDDKAQALAAFDRAIDHFQRLGVNVRLAPPPAGVKDINDMVRKGA